MAIVYFDLETQNMSFEVGGWANLEAVGLAVAVTWDEVEKSRTWWESQVIDLVGVLTGADMIVGYNVNRFDYRVLGRYSDLAQYLQDKTFDIIQEVQLQTGKLVGLNSLVFRNLGASKMGKSAGAVDLFRAGELEQLARYCAMDVELTRRLTEYWEKEGIVWISDVEYVIWPGWRPTSLEAAGMFGDELQQGT